MLFQSAKTVSGITVKNGEPLSFVYGSKRNISVTLRKFTEAELKGQNPNALLCLTIINKEPSQQIKNLFEKLLQGEFGNNYLESEWQLDIKDGRPSVKNTDKPSLIPQELLFFSKQISKEMTDYATRTIQVLRWRLNASSHQNPFMNAWFPTWSFDGKTWTVLPVDEIMHASIARPLLVPADIRPDIVRLINSGADEPLAHSLLREAYDHQGANPRSSLLTSIAAAEIGVKHLLTKLLPDTKWVLENLPSPPIIQILTQYFPQLLSERKIKRKNIPIPQSIIDTLRNGIVLRNSVTHTGLPKIEFEKLDEILHTVEDLLWILDYYSGYDWALNYMSPDIKDHFKP